jgi:hypothetical protein
MGVEVNRTCGTEQLSKVQANLNIFCESGERPEAGIHMRDRAVHIEHGVATRRVLKEVAIMFEIRYRRMI